MVSCLRRFHPTTLTLRFSFFQLFVIERYWRGSVSNVPCGIVDTGSGVWTTVSSYVSTLSAYLDLCTWSEMIDMRAQYCNILGFYLFSLLFACQLLSR